MALAFRPLAILLVYGKCTRIPYLRTFRRCTVVSKTAAREQKLEPCPEIPYCPEIPSLTLVSLAIILVIHNYGNIQNFRCHP